MKNSRVSDVRIVKCPKCTKLLPEPADVPFYICGGCNTTLQAKYYKKADERRNTLSGGSGLIKINEDDSVNEPGHLKVEKPSKSLINTGEGLGDHGSVGEHEDGKASSSNEPKEQVRQDEIVVEEELLSVNSSSEDASSETNTTKSEEKSLSSQEAGELNQNDDASSCRLEQDEVASSSREVLLSSENSQHKTTAPVQTAELEPKLGVSSFRSEPTRPDDPGVGVKKLTSKLGSPDGEVNTQNITANHSKEQPGFGVKYESEVSYRDEHVSIDGSSSQLLRSKQFGGVSSEIVTSSNDSVLIQDREPRHSTTENEERDEASLQNGTVEHEDNKLLDSLPSEINSSFRINSEKMDESASLKPEAMQRAGSNLSSKPEVSTPSGQDGKGEPEQSFQVDAPAHENNRVPAVNAIPKEKMADLRQTVDRFESKPSSKITETAAISANLQATSSYGDFPKSPTRNSFASEGSVSSCDGNDNKSHRYSSTLQRQPNGESDQSFEVDAPAHENNRVPAVNAIPKEKMADLRQTVDRFESKPSSKITETAAISANLQATSSYGDFPKSPTRNSFASEGSVSSCDGNDNKSHRYSSTLQRQPNDLQTLSGSDSFHSAAQSIPAMLDELKTSRGFSNGSHRRTRTRPNTGQLFPRPSIYRRSPNTSYESSTRASLVHEEIYDHPESRIARRIFTDPICPYHEPNERYRICCQGARAAYHVNDPHYHLPPAFESWSSHLPYHHRNQYIPREPFDSYTDSDYYEDQRQRDHDKRMLRSERKSRALQHFQPVVGAAPFITCYKCSELLQLPSDFLLFKGMRLHRVKCSACLAVLKYSLENGRNLVPYSPKKNDADEGAKSSLTLQKCASASACDSEKMSLRSSSTKHCRDKGKNVMAEAPDGPRVTWKQPSRTSPPLHRLMGYSSISAALDGRVRKDQEATAESM